MNLFGKKGGEDPRQVPSGKKAPKQPDKQQFWANLLATLLILLVLVRMR